MLEQDTNPNAGFSKERHRLRRHSPKDPFSGGEFEYEITPNGFILRCRAKDLDDDRVWQYEFYKR